MPNPNAVDPQDLTPYTQPGLQQRISNAIAALRGAPTQSKPAPAAPKQAPAEPQGVKTQDDPAGRALPDANLIGSWYRQYADLLGGATSRQRRYKEYDSMDLGQIAAMLDSIVDSCLVSDDGKVRGIKIQAASKYETVLNDVVVATNLNFFLREVLRDFLKYGDNWVGYIFDPYLNIVDFDNPPPGQMWTFVDRNMRLLTGTEHVGNQEFARAYQQKNDALTTLAAWHPFEMVHLKFRPSKRLIYSQGSFLEDIRGDWYKLRLIEESLVMHRVMRASPRLVHKLDVTGKTPDQAQEALDAYVEMLKGQRAANDVLLHDTMAVDQDYFLTTQYRKDGGDGKLYPSLNDVQHLDPRNTGLAQLPDVDYFVKKQFARVPSESVGILSDRQDISTQDIAASRFYAYLQYLLEIQFLRPCFNLALLLKGYKPQDDDYQIIFPSVQLRTSWRFADAQFRQSMADANDVATGINNRKNIAQDKYGWSDAEWDAHVAQFKKEQAVFAPPEPAPAVGGNQNPKANSVTKIRQGNNSA